MDFLSDLNKIVEEYLPKIAKMHHHRTGFRKSMEAFLSHPFKERSWPEIFNGRMYSYQDVLSTDTVENYIRLLRYFVDLVDDPKKMKKKDKDNLATAKDLLQFLNLHRMDPDNSLLGLAPSPKIMVQHCKRIREAHSNAPQDVLPLSTADLKAESLILRIMRWSEQEDDEEIVKEVKTFAYQLLTNISLNVGDLVLARIPNKKKTGANSSAASSSNASPSADDGDDYSSGDSDDDIVGDDRDENASAATDTEDWQYCRIYRILGNRVIVHNSPLESKTFSVKTQDVIPFDAQMKSMLGVVKTMQKLVQDPVDILYGRIQRRVKKMLGRFLSEAGIDYFLLKKTFANQVSLYEQPQLERTLKELENLVENESKEFYSRMEESTSDEIQQFIAQLDPLKLFCPTREQSFKQLRNLPITAFAKNRLQYLILTAQTNLDILNLSRRHLLNGDTKRTVSEWYLNHIENSVDKWLEDKGYDWGSVPRDYIEKPPRGRHLNDVRDNLELLEAAMDVEANQHNVREFISDLKDEIYEKLDPFVNDMCIVLGDTLHMPTLTTETFPDICKRWVEGEIEQPEDEALAAAADDGMKDVEYILEMRRLESTTFSKQKTELTKVVPITGLILSRFHRIENELRTVLELWAHLDNEMRDANAGGFANMHDVHSAHMAALENFRAKNSSQTSLKEVLNANPDDDSQSNDNAESSSSSSSSSSSTGAEDATPLSRSSPAAAGTPEDGQNVKKEQVQINNAVAEWAGDGGTTQVAVIPNRKSRPSKTKSIIRNNRLSRMVLGQSTPTLKGAPHGNSNQPPHGNPPPGKLSLNSQTQQQSGPVVRSRSAGSNDSMDQALQQTQPSQSAPPGIEQPPPPSFLPPARPARPPSLQDVHPRGPHGRLPREARASTVGAKPPPLPNAGPPVHPPTNAMPVGRKPVVPTPSPSHVAVVSPPAESNNNDCARGHNSNSNPVSPRAQIQKQPRPLPKPARPPSLATPALTNDDIVSRRLTSPPQLPSSLPPTAPPPHVQQ